MSLSHPAITSMQQLVIYPLLNVVAPHTIKSGSGNDSTLIWLLFDCCLTAIILFHVDLQSNHTVTGHLSEGSFV